MSRSWWLAPLLVLALAVSPSFADDDEAEDEFDWRPIAEYTLKKKRGEQKYLVGWGKSRGIHALRFEVEGSPIEILSVVVYYAKGKSAQWKPDIVVPDLGTSPEMALDPALGYVTKVVLQYRLRPEEQSDRYDKDLKSDVLLTGRR